MNYLNIRVTGWLLALVSIVLNLSSCRKRDSLNTNELYVYAAPGTAAYNVLSGGSIGLMGNAILPGVKTSFPVVLSRAFEQDIEVQASIDTTLTDLYDSIYQKTSPSVPAGAFKLARGGKVTIKAGELYSSDSVEVALVDASLVEKNIKTYVIPVVLQMASNGPSLSATRQVMYVEVNVNIITAGISSLSNTASVSILLEEEDGENVGPDVIYLKGFLNMPVNINRDVTIRIKDNLSLVDSLRQASGTDFLPFPSNGFTLQKGSVVIGPGSTVSADSLAIKLTDLNAFETGKSYVLPVEIVKDSDPQAPLVNQSSRLVFIYLDVFKNNVDQSGAALTGSVMSRSDWTVKASSHLGAFYRVDKTIDGNKSSMWLAYRLPQWVDVDMSERRTVKGFTVSSSSFGHVFEFEVLSSNDGVRWKLEGVLYDEVSTDKVVKFITPVKARYFRFNVLKTKPPYGSYVNISEINATE